MIGAIGSEVLRARSGLSTLAVIVLAVFVPLIILTSDDTLGHITTMDATTATQIALAPIGWSFVAAAFTGAFGVTREFYYVSMNRTVVELGFRRVFVAKALAAVTVGLLLTTGVVAVWSAVVAIVLPLHGIAPVPSAGAAATLVGALPGAVLGSVMGASVGWIVGNYYVAAAVVLAGPLALELALLGTAPEVARFSPGLSLAGLASPQNHPDLLPAGVAGPIAVVWTVALAAAAWAIGRRRFA